VKSPLTINEMRTLLKACDAVGHQVSELDRKIVLARQDGFMTVLGVGPVTALALKATIDDPARFARSRSVMLTSGLINRRHASGEVD
jgi:transposase